MHGFPETDDLLPLVGSELTQIVLDPYQVGFVFSGPGVAARLSMSAMFTHVEPKGGTSTFEPGAGGKTLTDIRFHRLLLEEVAAVEVSSAGDRLQIRFVTGDLLIFTAEIGGRYEAGTLNVGGDRFRKAGFYVL